jgi:UDPglucose--hexose-1-phosphate uridylyltransferase
MAEIHFERWQQIACFHNPLKAGELDEQHIEVRLDPLLDHQSVFPSVLKGKAAALFPPTDREYLEQCAEKSKSQCFLCDGKWRQKTPRYSNRILPEGYLVKNDVALFPNLFPIAAYHAVVMVGNQHCRHLDDFPSTMIKDSLSVSLEFIRRCYRNDPGAIHFTINANYLFPAGASVMHPHLQILGSPFPGTHERALLARSHGYFEKHGTSYWLDLIATEKRLQERWIGEIDGSQWFTAYSPLGPNEVNAVLPSAHHFLDWGDAEINGVAEGLAKTLSAYSGLNLSTFNFSCFSAPLNSESEEFCSILRLINRQNVVPHYRTDDYYFQKILGSELIVSTPEELASFIRQYF